MTKLITKLRRLLGIKDKLVVLTSNRFLSEEEMKLIQRDLADQLPDHCQVVILPPGTNVQAL